VLADGQAKVPQRTGDALLAVINPAEDEKLAFTLAEGQAIARQFATSQLLVGRDGREHVVRAAVTGRAYVHFSCHGTYDWLNPPQSGLELAGGERLTLAELQTEAVDLSAARLVTLSACETGISDVFQGSAEEYVGLPAGFLLAGVPCVVSSLWSVPDLSTALLMERFYQLHRQERLEACAALRAAQAWVRQLSIGEVAAYAEQVYRRAEPAYQPTLLTYWQRYRYLAQLDATLRPFAHPFYWAAFTVNGV
jgi:CHAT domain-containing protein